MSLELQTHYAIKYHDDLIELAQQRTSRLEGTVRTDPDYLEAKYGYFDRLGAIEAQEMTGRLQDTQWTEPDLTRRRIILRDFYVSTPIDKAERRRLLKARADSLPQKYLDNAIRGLLRKKDDLIIAAATGNAYGVDKDDAASAIALPSSQIVAVNSSGLTLAKLLSVKEIIDGADADPEEERTAVVTAKQVTNMLTTTEITSADYAGVKALAEGKVDTFLGFNFIRSERLTNDSSGDRQCLFYCKSALGLAMGEDIDTDIGVRRDKSMATQVWTDFSCDATRIEDEKIVVVKCQES